MLSCMRTVDGRRERGGELENAVDGESTHQHLPPSQHTHTLYSNEAIKDSDCCVATSVRMCVCVCVFTRQWIYIRRQGHKHNKSDKNDNISH